MRIKTKFSLIALVLVAFVVGGIVFNAYRVSAVARENGGSGYKFGFFRGEWRGFDRIDPEQQAKMEEIRVKMEERRAEMGEWKDMSPEERQAKMEKFKANIAENGEWKGCGLRAGARHLFGLRGFKGFGDEVSHEVVNLDNGIQITITSDDSEIVQKLQEAAARIKNNSGE